MIGILIGQPIEYDGETVILNVRGVGYELHCSKGSIDSFMGRDTVKAYIYTSHREDAMLLYGFCSKSEKNLFLSLIKVNGIGPKMALQAISQCQPEKIISMIDRGDVAGLSELPKIGKKKAEQIVLTLKGKLIFSDAESQTHGFVARADIISALVNLGFRMNDVETVVKDMESNTDLQQGIRQGLAALTAQV